MKPLGQAQANEKVRIRVALLDALHRRVGQMVVVAVRDHDGVNVRQRRNVAGRRREALRGQPLRRCAAVLKDRVEEHAQAGRELDIVAGMAQPGGAELVRARARRQEFGLHDIQLHPGGICQDAAARESVFPVSRLANPMLMTWDLRSTWTYNVHLSIWKGLGSAQEACGFVNLVVSPRRFFTWCAFASTSSGVGDKLDGFVTVVE